MAENLLERLGVRDRMVEVISDGAFFDLARAVATLHPNSRVRPIATLAAGDFESVLEIEQNRFFLLLAEPETYREFELYRHLDFSKGEPCLPGLESCVLIFPHESLMRMLSADAEQDRQEKARILFTLQNHTQYRITTDAGTDLVFRARNWIPLDFEVCTAPVETSVEGRIVVDGALFFRASAQRLIFHVHEGQLVSVEAQGASAQKARYEYLAMTENAMKDSVNRRLAEIGIGFCHGAQVSDCFMEAETAAHTCHFCFGNNVCYGGENASDFHGASILIRNPVFTPIL